MKINVLTFLLYLYIIFIYYIYVLYLFSSITMVDKPSTIDAVLGADIYISIRGPNQILPEKPNAFHTMFG